MRTEPRGRVWTRRLVVSLPLAFPGCSIDLSNLTAPVTFPGATCDLPATSYKWGIWGFVLADVVQPIAAGQSNLTATVAVGQRRRLRAEEMLELNVRAQCNSKIQSVEWVSTSPDVARLETDAQGATLVAVRPGEATIFANLTFGDGSPPIPVLPTLLLSLGPTVWANITVVRVSPSQ